MDEPAADTSDTPHPTDTPNTAETLDSTHPHAEALRLGQSYAAMLSRTEWHVESEPPLEDVDSLAGDSSELSAPPSSAPHSSGPSAPIPSNDTSQNASVEIPVPQAVAALDATVPPSPRQIIEAALFLGGPALSADRVSGFIRGMTATEFAEIIDQLNETYRLQNRPYGIRRQSDGYVLRLKPRYAGIRQKLFGGPREARLMQPALDVLCMVAYRQPIGKGEIDAVRGADSGGILRQLVRLGLIGQSHLDRTEQNEPTYRTTPRFLEVFRLRNLDDLPRVGDAKKVVGS